MVVCASPGYGEVSKYVKSAWKDAEVVRIRQLRKEIYLFDFQCEDDRAKFLEGRWAIYNRFHLLLKPWTMGSNINQCFDKISIGFNFYA